MSGALGIGFRINADDKEQVSSYAVENLVNSVVSIPNVQYVICNLSDAAHGDAYLAPHSVLTELTPSATPDDDRDLFLELATAFQAKGIKVIAYMATQGPAMLKHGAEKAFDATLNTNGSYSSQAMQNWENYVLTEYGQVSAAVYKKAYVEVIVEEYAIRYKDVIDGWWFDHSNFANIPLLHDTLEAIDPTDVITFNDGQKIPLINNNPAYEDYTFGHPNPVARTPTSHAVNLPMLTSIEETSDGFLEADGQYSLGHMFITPTEVWNAGDLVWTTEQAKEWQNRCLAAGGAWTWNLDLDDNNYTLRTDLITFLQSFNFTAYHTWLNSHGESNTIPQLDTDQDGIPNLVEYALGSNPTETNDGLNAVHINTTDSTHTIVVLRDPSSLEDTAQTLEYSFDLVNWTEVDISDSTASNVSILVTDEGMDEVIIDAARPNAIDNEFFWRLKVELQ